jgi:hypothetical protein
MTARISRAFSFQAGAYFKNSFTMNLYHVDIDFQIETSSMKEQNIALERIKYFINDIIDNSILIKDSQTEMIEKYQSADFKICALPEDPYDQIIAIMLLVKGNTITEGKLVITDISITSRLSDNVFCNHSIEEFVGPFKEQGWWLENNDKINSFKPSKSKKIVKLTKTTTSWEDLFLGWEENVSNYTSEVVFLNFDGKEK